jgi:hypothetical protein
VCLSAIVLISLACSHCHLAWLRASLGGKCGGTYIDRNLYKLLKERFGSAFTSLPPERIGPGSEFMQSFESKKKNFQTETASRRPIKLRLVMPQLSHQLDIINGYDRKYSEVLLTHDDMKTCFDPVINKVLELLESQVTAVWREGKPPIETIILVGGLGESPYLRERLFEWTQERNIRLTTPWTGG